MTQETCCLISAYNAAGTIAKCLESCTEFDLVILWDDGSTDGTAEIARAFPNVRLVGGKTNVGIQQARYELYLASAGFKYVSYLDADDWRLPGLLDGQIKELGDADVLLSPIVVLPKNFVPVVTDVIKGILSVSFQTGGLLMRRRALDALYKRFGYVWRIDATCYLEGLFAWDLYRSGAKFAYSSHPASVYNRQHSAEQFTAKLKMSDRDKFFQAIVVEMKEFLGDAWAEYQTTANQYQSILNYRLKREPR